MGCARAQEASLMQVSVYIAVTLDGFIARTSGGLDFLDDVNKPPEGEDYGYKAFMDSIDALVMGRNSFEKVVSFGVWPYEKPVIVMSQTLKRIPEGYEERAELFAGSPQEVVAKLELEGLKRVYLDGGKLVQSFLREDLVTDMIISRVPVLIGQGIPLFGSLANDVKLEHLSTQSFITGLVQSEYRVLK